jgi:hypothetical protein
MVPSLLNRGLDSVGKFSAAARQDSLYLRVLDNICWGVLLSYFLGFDYLSENPTLNVPHFSRRILVQAWAALQMERTPYFLRESLW